MSLKTIRLVYELLTEQMNHWMLFPIALTMMEMTRGQTGMSRPDLLLWILCSVFPLMFFGLRVYHSKRKKVYLCILLHLGAAGAYAFVLLTPSRPFICRYICVLCALGYMMQSLVLQLKKESLYTAPIQLPAGVALSFVAAFMRHTDQWNPYYSFSLIGVAALFFLVFYIRQYLDFIALNKGTAGHIPVREMFRSGTGLAAGYTLFGAVVLTTAAQYEWLTKVLRPVGNFLLDALRFLLSKLPKLKNGEELSAVEDNSKVLGTPQLAEPQEAFWLWKFLEIAAGAALILCMLYLAFRLLGKLLRLLQDYLNRRLARTEDSAEELPDFREKCISVKSEEKKKRRFAAAFSNRERVRRLYKRKLLFSISPNGSKPQQGIRTDSAGSLGLHTAREWERELQTKGMAEIYERTRYSEYEITAGDVKKMREACK